MEDEEKSRALGLAERWQKLIIDAKTRDLRLVYVKDQFRDVTKQQAIDFQEEVKELRRAFYTTGPGAPSIDLEHGVDQVDEYQKKLLTYNSRKADLINAEGLFNLPATSYPVLQVSLRMLFPFGCFSAVPKVAHVLSYTDRKL